MASNKAGHFIYEFMLERQLPRRAIVTAKDITEGVLYSKPFIHIIRCQNNNTFVLAISYYP